MPDYRITLKSGPKGKRISSIVQNVPSARDAERLVPLAPGEVIVDICQANSADRSTKRFREDESQLLEVE